MDVERFVELLTGNFDNKEQFEQMKASGKTFPYAQHVNTVCNDKIKNIPNDFNGIFIRRRKLLRDGWTAPCITTFISYYRQQ